MLKKVKKIKKQCLFHSPEICFQVSRTSSAWRYSPPSISHNVLLPLFIFDYSFLEAIFKFHLFYKSIALNSSLSSSTSWPTKGFCLYLVTLTHVTSYSLIFCIFTLHFISDIPRLAFLFFNNLKLVLISPVHYAHAVLFLHIFIFVSDIFFLQPPIHLLLMPLSPFKIWFRSYPLQKIDLTFAEQAKCPSCHNLYLYDTFVCLLDEITSSLKTEIIPLDSQHLEKCLSHCRQPPKRDLEFNWYSST